MNTPSPLLYLVQFALILGVIAGIICAFQALPQSGAVQFLGVAFGVVCTCSCAVASLALSADSDSEL